MWRLRHALSAAALLHRIERCWLAGCLEERAELCAEDEGEEGGAHVQSSLHLPEVRCAGVAVAGGVDFADARQRVHEHQRGPTLRERGWRHHVLEFEGFVPGGRNASHM